jgi:hypothetical protein
VRQHAIDLLALLGDLLVLALQRDDLTTERRLTISSRLAAVRIIESLLDKQEPPVDIETVRDQGQRIENDQKVWYVISRGGSA